MLACINNLHQKEKCIIDQEKGKETEEEAQAYKREEEQIELK